MSRTRRGGFDHRGVVNEAWDISALYLPLLLLPRLMGGDEEVGLSCRLRSEMPPSYIMQGQGGREPAGGERLEGERERDSGA